jgi:DNA-binding CsgD family transcriptional regulator
MKRDLVGTIEAAYEMEQDDRTWLTNIVAAAQPGLEAGLGVFGVLYDASDGRTMRITDVVLRDTPARLDDATIRDIVQASGAQVTRSFRVWPCAMASEIPGMDSHPLHAARFGAVGVGDVMGVNGVDPSGVGCIIGAFFPQVRRLRPRERLTWSRVSVHLAAGFRLRRRIGRGPGLPALTEAVMTPAGRIEHAEGDATTQLARRTLRTSALALTRARGPRRTTAPDAAVADWQGLWGERWSLLDHFESDGRQYVIACTNQSPTPPAQRLTARERQVVACAALGHPNKVIAYELGIAASTVGVLLSRARARLGLRSRAELLEAFRAGRLST